MSRKLNNDDGEKKPNERQNVSYELVELAQILERTHFNDQFKPPNRPRERVSDISFMQTPYDQRRVKEHMELWVKAKARAEENLNKSRIAAEKAKTAAELLKRTKQIRAQMVREQSMRFSVERLKKDTDERVASLERSRIRLEVWEKEAKDRREAIENAHKQQLARNLIRRGETQMALQTNQLMEIERLKALQFRMNRIEQKRIVSPRIPFKFNAYRAPGESIAETMFKLTLNKQKEEEKIDKIRVSIYEGRFKKSGQDRATAHHSTATVVNQQPVPSKSPRMKTPTDRQNQNNLKETEAQEIIRLNREIHLLEKQLEDDMDLLEKSKQNEKGKKKQRSFN